MKSLFALKRHTELPDRSAEDGLYQVLPHSVLHDTLQNTSFFLQCYLTAHYNEVTAVSYELQQADLE